MSNLSKNSGALDSINPYASLLGKPSVERQNNDRCKMIVYAVIERIDLWEIDPYDDEHTIDTYEIPQCYFKTKEKAKEYIDNILKAPVAQYHYLDVIKVEVSN